MRDLEMGNICAQLRPQNKNSNLPPPDLTTLLLNYEKSLPDSSYWLENFKAALHTSDTRTEQTWRVNLLDFVLLCRDGIKTNLANPHNLQALQVHLEEGGVAVSDYSLRETLSEELDQLAEASQGAKGTRAVLSGSRPSPTKAVSSLTRVLLDPSVFKTLENEYYRYLKSSPSPPALAVILSIL